MEYDGMERVGGVGDGACVAGGGAADANVSLARLAVMPYLLSVMAVLRSVVVMVVTSGPRKFVSRLDRHEWDTCFLQCGLVFQQVFFGEFHSTHRVLHESVRRACVDSSYHRCCAV